jgi:shikimate dehydrogenase
MINKDTLLFGSFSKKAGNVGCMFFNTYFQQYNINAIYKSFSIESIEEAVLAAKTLQFSGFGVSMPFKSEIVKFLDKKDPIVDELQSCNTVVIKNSLLYGYNTDFYAVLEYLKEHCSSIDTLYVLGTGAYSKTVQACCHQLKKTTIVINRDNWHLIQELRNACIFNCTPVENLLIHDSNIFIDCINTTPTGAELARKQAIHQFKLYTGIELKE